MAYIGKTIRLNRILSDKSRKYLGLTIDHAMARGVLPGLDSIKATLENFVAGNPDAITMHKGIAQRFSETFAGKVPFVLKCSTFGLYHSCIDVPVADVEEGIRLGADAISVGCIVGGDDQPDQLQMLANYCRNAESVGLPIFAHIYPRGNQIPDKDQTKWENVLYATRIAAELGVDLIKTNYTGDPESFAKVVRGTPAPVVIAGGNDIHTAQKMLETTIDALTAGAIGVTYGRVVFQYKNPTALIKTLHAIIHQNYCIGKAMAYLSELESTID
ncbi:MAG: class I fructose-bisphosphate aldolase [Christensenellales bacterium]|jgi:class I fructose-bisphosphate aldolase